jgi:hypothetical protein
LCIFSQLLYFLSGWRPFNRQREMSNHCKTIREGNYMLRRHWVTGAGLAVLIFSAASTARAQTVTFTEITDAVPGRFFDAAATAPDASNANRLHIGLHTGIDFRTLKYRDFRASSTSFSYGSAGDTISFRVTAPEGYYIARITYTQRGAGSVVRTGRAAGITNLVAGDVAAGIGDFATNPSVSGTIDLTGRGMTSVPVSITNTLFAFSTPLLGSATVGITSADVFVELQPLTN